MSFTIRHVEQKDLSQLIQLCKLHAEFERSSYDSNGKEEAISSHLFSNAPSLFCLVVEDKTELIGYTTYMKQFSTWDAANYLYMDCLFLKSSARSQGIGEQIINRLKAEATKLNCTHLQWQTPVFNTRAIKFYDRIGGIAKSKERYFLQI